MSTTPSGKSNPSADTPGFARGLFGSLFSSRKAPRTVDYSTSSTAPVTRWSAHNHPSSLEIQLKSPSERERGNPTSSHTPAIDLLDTASPPATKPVSNISLPTKSPWKSPTAPTINGQSAAAGAVSVQFSLGNLKPPPSAGGRRSVSAQTSSVARQRRSKYKPSTLLLSAKRRRISPVNATHAVNALQHSQSLFQPSRRQLEARNNYTSFRAGKRLLGSSQRGGSRVAPSSGTDLHAEESQASSPTAEPASKRRKQVMFGGEDESSRPMDSQVFTPVRVDGSFKRKATPFKIMADTDMDSEPASPPKTPSIPQHSFSNHVREDRPALHFQMEKGSYSFEKPNEIESIGPAVDTRPYPMDLSAMVAERNPPAKTRRTYFETIAPASKKSKLSNKIQTAAASTIQPPAPTNPNETLPPPATQGWGDLFAAQRNQWKCEACAIRNDNSLTKCPACETVRPGYEDQVQSGSGPGAGSIGQGGFVFGGDNSSNAAGKSTVSTSGFTFGSTSAPSASNAPSVGGNNFVSASAPAQAPGDGGVKFGGSSDSTSKTSAKEGGGFMFGARAPAPSSGDSSGGGFVFGVTASSASTDHASSSKREESSKPAAAASVFGLPPSEKSAGSAITSFGAPATGLSNSKNSESEVAVKPLGFSFASPAVAPSSSTTNGERKSFQFSRSVDEKKSEDATKFSFSSSMPAASSPEDKMSHSEPRKEPTRSSNGDSAIHFESSTTVSESKRKNTSSKPELNLASNNGGTAPSTSFSFGRASESASDSAVAPFTFGGTSSASSLADKMSLPQSRMSPNKDSSNEDRSTQQGGRDDGESSTSAPIFGAKGPTSGSAPSFSFGGLTPAPAPTPTTFGSQPAPEKSIPTFGGSMHLPPEKAPAPVFSFGGSSSASAGFKFGSQPSGNEATSAPNFGTKHTDSNNPSAPVFGSSTVTSASSNMSAPQTMFGDSASVSFGSSAPTPAEPSTNPFGSAPATSTLAPVSGFSFGNSVSTSGAQPAFGAAPGLPPFGASSATAPPFGMAPAAPSFGSAPASAPFGSTPGASFGAAPAPPTFGSVAPAPAPFGSMSTAAPFGGAVSGDFSAGGFGGAPPAAAPAPFGQFGTTSNQGGFGAASFGAPPPAAPGGFSAPPVAVVGDAPQFNIGSGGGGGANRGPAGRRRIVRARRPRQA